MNISNPYNLPTEWSEVCSNKSVILGLKRYAFRREYSAAKLAIIGYSNIELIDSFDGWEEDIESAFSRLGIQVNPTIGKGHKGCIYSHIFQWKRIIDESIPYMTIFEDDCIGHTDLSKGLGQKFWDATPKDFDICY